MAQGRDGCFGDSSNGSDESGEAELVDVLRKSPSEPGQDLPRHISNSYNFSTMADRPTNLRRYNSDPAESGRDVIQKHAWDRRRGGSRMIACDSERFSKIRSEMPALPEMGPTLTVPGLDFNRHRHDEGSESTLDAEMDGEQVAVVPNTVPQGLLSRTLIVLRHYYVYFVGYFTCLIFLSAGLMKWFGDPAPFLDLVFLAVSAFSCTGLASVDFLAQPFSSHVITLMLIFLGNPLLLSLVPVIIRLRCLHLSPRNESAFFGLSTTAKDELYVLRIITGTVVGYWMFMIGAGTFLLYAYFPEDVQERCWFHSLFLAAAAFHNAGLVTLEKGLPFDETDESSIVLSVVMVLVLCGNTCYPIVLRLLLVVIKQLHPDGSNKQVMRLLLKYPRSCYTHLFPGAATWWLCVVSALLVLMQFVALMLVEFTETGQATPFHGMSTRVKMWGVVFQCISTRTAGFAVVDCSLLSATTAFVFCVCMWISVSPLVVAMRTTMSLSPEDESSERRSLRHQLQTFMSENSAILIVCLFLILYINEVRDTYKFTRHNFLHILFEFCSAYGTVGMSMTHKGYSRCGDWSPYSKMVLMFVMVLGRLRGLPDAIDPTFMLQGITTEDEDLQRSLAQSSNSETGSVE